MTTFIGITEAADALEAARDLLEAEQVTATFNTQHGQVRLTAQAAGLTVLVDGQPVPIRRHAA